MGAHAEPQAGSAQLLKLIGRQRVEVFLSEVDAVGAGRDGDLPVVVDEQQRTGAAHRFDGGLHFARDGLGVVRLEAQLHRRYAGARHAADPRRVGQHGIEAEPFGAGRKGVVARGRRKRAHAEIDRRIGPCRRVELAAPFGLRAPRMGEAFGVDLDEAERGAGLFGAPIDGVVGGKTRRAHGRGRGGAEAQAVGRDDGLRHGAGVGGVDGVHGAWCQKGVPSTGVLGCAASCAAIAPAR
ncbi:hypothetical protein D3C87_1506130 [compost metagenome]